MESLRDSLRSEALFHFPKYQVYNWKTETNFTTEEEGLKWEIEGYQRFLDGYAQQKTLAELDAIRKDQWPSLESLVHLAPHHDTWTECELYLNKFFRVKGGDEFTHRTIVLIVSENLRRNKHLRDEPEYQSMRYEVYMKLRGQYDEHYISDLHGL